MCSLHGCYNVATPRVAIPWVAIPCVAHGKLYETCMLHAMKKCSPCKLVTGMHCSFLVAPRIDIQVKNEVVIERYCTYACTNTEAQNMVGTVYVYDRTNYIQTNDTL